MTNTIFEQLQRLWTETVLDSIYKLYPRKENRKAALQRIREALDRICDGEIDGKPRTQEEAITYLRERTEAARQAMYGRESKFIPHPATWYHQSRYLRPVLANDDLPANLEDCVAILAEYPNSRSVTDIRHDLRPYLPALTAISKAIDKHDVSFVVQQTKLYAAAVASWPQQERRYVPNALRWFGEGRYEQNPQLWQRTNSHYQTEREQIARVLQSK